MHNEGTPESQKSENGNQAESPAHKRSWVRIVVYLMLACVLGLISWRIYQNQQQTRLPAPARRRRC